MACLETYASLRVFSSSLDPDEITKVLGIDPTICRPIDPASKYRPRREHNYWDWESRSSAQPKDGLAHINAIIDILQGKEAALRHLRERGCEVDVCCYWVSSGQGGPSLDLPAIEHLARLSLPIWWDVYFGDADDYESDAPEAAGGA